MAKWKLEDTSWDTRVFAGQLRRLIVRTLPGLSCAIPFSAGGIISRAEWLQIRKLIDQFYERIYGEAPSITLSSGETEDTIEYMNKLRMWRKRRVVEECQNGGYVYFLRGERYCKIGQTTRLEQRLKTLAIQLPFKVELFHSIPTATPVGLERQFHERFKEKRANGEWFALDEDDFRFIKNWDRGSTAVDCALEIEPNLTALSVLAELRKLDLTLDFTNWYARVISATGLNDEAISGINQVLELWREEVDDLLEGQVCDHCGSRTYRSALLPDSLDRSPDKESDEQRDVELSEDEDISC